MRGVPRFYEMQARGGGVGGEGGGGLIPCFCQKYLGRAHVTRLTEGRRKKGASTFLKHHCSLLKSKETGRACRDR